MKRAICSDATIIHNILAENRFIATNDKYVK